MRNDSLFIPDVRDFARYWLRRPTSLILGSNFRLPRDVMEELRRDDPTGHALLSEHIVLPESNRDSGSDEAT